MVKDFNFAYPIVLTEQEEGGYVVQFVDFPEAITQGETIEEALYEAADCLEEAIANRIVSKLAIPEPSNTRKEHYLVHLSLTFIAKVILYLEMKEQKLNNVSLAKKLKCDEKEIRRMLDPHHHTKLPAIEEALKLMGKRLEIVVKKQDSIITKRLKHKKKIQKKRIVRHKHGSGKSAAA